jgi:PKD repeat protein
MPQAGDSLRFSVATLDTAVLFGFQNSGANQQWNFDSLQALRQGVNRYYASANTPYNSQVSNRIGLKVADTLALGGTNLYDVYDFFNNNSSEFAKDYRAASVPLGFGNFNIAPSYSDKDEIYQFPLNYLDRDSSSFNFTFNNPFPPAYYSSSGYRINEVDAWGTLKTPFGTFNCLRVITDVVAYDTVSFSGNNFGINSHTREYKWLTTQFGIPAMIVSGNVVAGAFIPTNVQYRDSVRNVPSIFAPVALFTADSTVASIGDTVTLNNNSISLSPSTYQWNITPSTHQFTNGTNANTMSPELTFSANGFYDIQLIITNSEGSDTLLRNSYVEIKNFTSLNELIENDQLFSIYPNPQKIGETLVVTKKHSVKVTSLELLDINGRLVRQIENSFNGNKILISTNELKSGQYLIRIDSQNGTSIKPIILR